MRESHWTGTGPDFKLSWGGRDWSLIVDETRPGLRHQSGGSVFELLALQGVSRPGRFEPGAFTRATLVGFECQRARVQATFAPAGWDGLLVRAAWSPVPRRDAIDVEIQVSASSVEALRSLEVAVVSQAGDAGLEPRPAAAGWVEARDAGSAALTYDGREPAGTLRGLTTLPLPDSPALFLRPRVFAPPGVESGVFYVEMAHPDDVSRRITGEDVHDGSTTAVAFSTRYGLFGHDLEKGIVLRARLRGHWIRSTAPEDDAQSLYHEFLSEPLPLGP